MVNYGLALNEIFQCYSLAAVIILYTRVIFKCIFLQDDQVYNFFMYAYERLGYLVRFLRFPFEHLALHI
jgi:hypothetical protein